MDLNKILKIVIIFVLLIVAGSISYYYLILLPRSTNREFQTRREEKCIELANNERSRQEAEEKIGEYLTEFKYKYDKKSDSCFVYFRQLDNCPATGADCRTYETIRNLFTGEIVDEFSYRASDFSYPDTASLFNEFNKKIEQIFGK